MKLKEIGEHGFIKDVISRYVSTDVNLDVYVHDGIVLKVDGFPISNTLPFMDLYDIGWKAVVATFSDLISSGSVPKFILSSVGLNPELEVDEAQMLMKGIKDAADYYESSYVGGDTNSTNGSGWIDIVGCGELICHDRPKPEPGDIIFITGKLGYTTNAFLWYTSKGKVPLLNEAKQKLMHPIVNRTLIKLHKKACGVVAFSTDISDGLLVTLKKMINYLGNGVNLHQIPLIDFTQELVDNGTYGIEDILKFSGEEYETIFVVKKPNSKMFEEIAKSDGLNVIRIGEVIESKSITLNSKMLEIHGWDNFKGWF
ncbi:thiamine-monophosphate kinase [Metallosphaera tengchongensis]|uniref:Thiamine-monophosphate kinase n=1 Tax=Metallosphaera tengchongensis TaxID=1532350 RepID=A0A6N0NW20_9CREN|nr:AIR synthase related protein [Metallosphaera tengchongensis]QKQ99848.1 thiamine-monophosphate kinase [Metallosphaera tengchongensis]